MASAQDALGSVAHRGGNANVHAFVVQTAGLQTRENGFRSIPVAGRRVAVK